MAFPPYKPAISPTLGTYLGATSPYARERRGARGVIRRGGYYGTPLTATAPQVPTAPAGAGRYNQLLAQIAALERDIAATRPPALPAINLSDVYGRARRQAQAAVNPFFQRQLNTFLKSMYNRRLFEREKGEREKRDLEQQLQDYLGQAGVTRARTTEDVGERLRQISESERLRQETEARQFDIGRRGLQERVGQAGLTLSGLGRQRLLGARAERGAREEAQTLQVQRQQREQQLLKTRTFEDLARGEKIKTRDIGRRKEEVKINVDRLLQELSEQEELKKLTLEMQRRESLFEEEARQRQLAFQGYLRRLSPRQMAYAQQVYGGRF